MLSHRVSPHRFRRSLGLAVLLSGALSLLNAAPSRAAEGPTLIKRTVIIRLKRYLRYWPSATAKEPTYNTYSWVPQISFDVLGSVPGGSQFIAEFSKPTGAPWFNVDIKTDEVEDDVLSSLKTEADDDLEKKATIAIGSYPFKIRLKNALSGQNTVIFSGKYQVVKYALLRVPASDKNKTDFTTNEDWRAPIGYLWLNPADDNADVPPLSTQMWFHGAAEGSKMQAILFRDGKQIDSNSGVARDTIQTPSSDDATNWYFWQFTFPKTRGFNNSSAANDWTDTLFLDKSPGNYEIRVLRNGKLARLAKFVVGADGKIVDNGIATANKMGGIRLVLPVTVSDKADGALRPGTWKTQAFYGNPLTGFVAP